MDNFFFFFFFFFSLFYAASSWLLLKLPKLIGHFRVASFLCVKTSLRAKSFIWNCIPPTGSFLCKSNSFSPERFCTSTRFETEVQGNSALAYFQRRQTARQEFKQAVYSYFRFWTGSSLQLRLMQGVFSNANDINLFLMIFTRKSLHCKLVPVQRRKYEYGLFSLMSVPSLLNP